MNGIDIILGFQDAVNQIGLKDNNGDKLIETGIIDTQTNEVIKKILVTKGEHNELVKWIQQRLNALGFSCGENEDDSFFGVSTLVAVNHFQFLYGLKSDGCIGPLSIIELLK